MKLKLSLGIVSGVALATLGTASAAQAALVVVPTDLLPGAQYRLVFVTAGTRNATSTNIDDYNTFVTNEATGGTPGIDTALDTALNNETRYFTGFFNNPPPFSSIYSIPHQLMLPNTALIP